MRRPGGWLAPIGISALLALMAFPLYWTVKSSLVPEAQLFERPTFLPRQITFEHYRSLFELRRFWVPIRNSLVVAGLTTVMAVAIGSLCAYAIARLRFRGKTLLLSFMLAVSMFPQISIVAPLYLVLREVGLINTYPGLVLPYLTFATPLTVWLLVGYFRQLPPDLEDAARVDGASRMRTFREVVVPLSIPGIVTTAILTFLYAWNEFIFALSFTVGPDRQTVPVAIALFRGRYQVPWGEILAGVVVATLPVALIVLAFQRRIVRGLTSGAVKG